MIGKANPAAVHHVHRVDPGVLLPAREIREGRGERHFGPAETSGSRRERAILAPRRDLDLVALSTETRSPASGVQRRRSSGHPERAGAIRPPGVMIPSSERPPATDGMRPLPVRRGERIVSLRGLSGAVRRRRVSAPTSCAFPALPRRMLSSCRPRPTRLIFAPGPG